MSSAAVQACLPGEASIRRARSLFADAAPTSAPAEAAQLLTDAADTTTAAGRRTSGLSGQGIDAHHQFVNTSTPAITTSALNDLVLGDLLEAAAVITTAGAEQLDAIAQQARATTPAVQRAVLAVMKTRIQAADNVVQTTRRQAAGAGRDEFDLDTQYSRPQGLPGAAAPLVNPTDWTPSTPSMCGCYHHGDLGMWARCRRPAKVRVVDDAANKE